MNTINSKTSELDKFVLNLSQKVDLRSSNKQLLFKTYLFIARGKTEKIENHIRRIN